VRDNLRYLDYAVVAAIVLFVGYLVYKRVKDTRRHRRAGTGGRGSTAVDPEPPPA
jgi:hypothetical protein